MGDPTPDLYTPRSALFPSGHRLGWLYVTCGATTFVVLGWATSRQNKLSKSFKEQHYGKIKWLGFTLGIFFTSQALRW